MAEPTQAGAAAACPGPPRSCPHSGSCLGPPSPLQPQWLHGPSVGWDPTGIAPPASGASVGSPWGWESVRCWRGWGKGGGPALLSPPCQPCCQQPCLFPAYAADGNLPELLACSSATAASAGGVEQWGTSCRAQAAAVPSCTALAAVLQCCRAEGSVQPLGVLVGSNLAAAAPTPMPWCCLSLLSPWPCCGQASVVLAWQLAWCWRELGVRGAAGCGGGVGPWVS